jgi:hypothetical protein
LPAFAIWVAGRATAHKGKTKGEAAVLFGEARKLLVGVDKLRPDLDRMAAKAIHDRLKKFQNEYKWQQWGPVRIIHNWNLMLEEKGLAIYLWYSNDSRESYKLAADYCQIYDSRYGNGLNGPARAKIAEIVRFMFTLEGRDGESA